MSNAVLAPPPLESGTLRVIPLGGLGEVGRNMTIFELDGKILVVDCGVLFPEEHQGRNKNKKRKIINKENKL